MGAGGEVPDTIFLPEELCLLCGQQQAQGQRKKMIVGERDKIHLRLREGSTEVYGKPQALYIVNRWANHSVTVSYLCQLSFSTIKLYLVSGLNFR